MLSIPLLTMPKSELEARTMQSDMREKLILEDSFDKIDYIAGVDCGYDMANNLVHASIVVIKYDTLELVEQVQEFSISEFPYISGLLSFREIPAILHALTKIQTKPDLFMVDGQGIAHPRRMGIASHLGVLLNEPSIGVAKSRLTGKFEPVGAAKGDISSLMVGEEKIGIVLRSKERTNPLFISSGHKISLDTAVEITKNCFTRYRLPEPTRLADKLSKVKNTPK